MSESRPEPMDLFTELFLLRAGADELAEQMQKAPLDRFHFSSIPGTSREREERIEAADVLTASLGAVASANGRLAHSGLGLAMGGKPLTMQLVGDLIGISPETGEMELAVAPRGSRGKETTDAT